MYSNSISASIISSKFSHQHYNYIYPVTNCDISSNCWCKQNIFFCDFLSNQVSFHPFLFQCFPQPHCHSTPWVNLLPCFCWSISHLIHARNPLPNIKLYSRQEQWCSGYTTQSSLRKAPEFPCVNFITAISAPFSSLCSFILLTSGFFTFFIALFAGGEACRHVDSTPGMDDPDMTTIRGSEQSQSRFWGKF